MIKNAFVYRLRTDLKNGLKWIDLKTILKTVFFVLKIRLKSVKFKLNFSLY